MKRTLNLDSTFFPVEGPRIAFDAFTFHGGEPHIKIHEAIDAEDEVMITARLKSFNDVGFLCISVDALRRMGVKKIQAYIPYFPAARQDRVMIPGEPLSVKVYADIINVLSLDQVYVFDAHSEVTPAVLNNCTVIANHQFIKDVLSDIDEDCLLISPDGGALKKIYKVATYLGGKEVIECSKSRNVATGALSGFKVYADDLQGKSCLIVDDICDGGGTFLGLAEALKAKNAGKIYLAISHGIFSKGTALFKPHFEKIYTTNSFKDINEDGVKQINLSL